METPGQRDDVLLVLDLSSTKSLFANVVTHSLPGCPPTWAKRTAAQSALNWRKENLHDPNIPIRPAHCQHTALQGGGPPGRRSCPKRQRIAKLRFDPAIYYNKVGNNINTIKYNNHKEIFISLEYLYYEKWASHN